MNPNTVPAVTIGIPAYNEADNLRHLVPSLLQQKAKHYKLDGIVILSDNSSDDTASLKKEFKKFPVTILIGNTQLGKPARVNQFFRRTDSDIVVVLDADIKLGDSSVLDELVMPIAKGSHTMSSGIAHPLPPANRVERIAYAGVQIWNNARLFAPVDSLYNCDGMIRAFSRNIYKNMQFPALGSTEDTYPYLYCVSHGWSFRSVPTAKVYYHLPSSFRDYRSQQRRYHTAPDVEKIYFSESLLSLERVITKFHKAIALCMYAFRDPLYTILYIVFSLYIRFDLMLRPEKYSAKWEILTSTKKVHS